MARFERKFITNPYDRHDLELFIKLLPGHFTELHYERFVNNIYFDDLDLNCFHDSINGAMERKKYRIRWYGDLFGQIDKPILEVKTKDNLLVAKDSYTLKPFKLDRSCTLDSTLEILREAKLPHELFIKLSSSNFSLLNRYRRKYFLSLDKKMRFTVDSDIEYLPIYPNWNSFSQKSFSFSNTILEMKYDPVNNFIAQNISSKLPFPLSKYSKYLRGVEKTLCVESS